MVNMYKTIINCDGQEVNVPKSIIVINSDGVEGFICPECNEFEPLTEVTIVGDGKAICLFCADWSYRFCEYHRIYESIETTRFYRIPFNNMSICEEGLNESDEFGRCPRCGEIIELESAFYDEETDNHYCGNCQRTIIRERNTFIRGYHSHKGGRVNLLYSPLDDGQRRNTIKFGFELEVDSNHDYDYEHNDTAKAIHELLNKTSDGRVVYFEKDGSLNNGFEIITEPMSINYIKENKKKLTQMLDILSDEGYVGHDKGTAGLHIHLTKSVLGDKGVENFCFFVENNQEDLTNFSRRKASHLNNYASFSMDSTELRHNSNGRNILMRRMNHQSRYHAINLGNSSTLELRIMRSTLNKETFFATLGFVSALGYYSINEEVTEDTTVKDIVDYAQVMDMPFYEEMQSYCVRRKITGFVQSDVAELA